MCLYSFISTPHSNLLSFFHYDGVEESEIVSLPGSVGRDKVPSGSDGGISSTFKEKGRPSMGKFFLFFGE